MFKPCSLSNTAKFLSYCGEQFSSMAFKVQCLEVLRNNHFYKRLFNLQKGIYPFFTGSYLDGRTQRYTQKRFKNDMSKNIWSDFDGKENLIAIIFNLRKRFKKTVSKRFALLFQCNLVGCLTWEKKILKYVLLAELRIHWQYPLGRGKTSLQKEVSCLWYWMDGEVIVLDILGMLSITQRSTFALSGSAGLGFIYRLNRFFFKSFIFDQSVWKKNPYETTTQKM